MNDEGLPGVGSPRYDKSVDREIVPVSWQTAEWLPDTSSPCRLCLFDPKKLHDTKLCAQHPCNDIIWMDVVTIATLRLTRKSCT